MAKFKPKPYQDEIKKFILNRFKRPGKTYAAITLAPGKGKTATAMMTFVAMRRRFMMVLLPKYFKKWESDLKYLLGFKDEDILFVSGSDALKSLMNMDKKDIPKVVIISNRTLALMLDKLKDIPDGEYPMHLSKLMEHCDIDTILLDEVHQEFNSIARAVTILNPYNLLALSATIESGDRIVNDLMGKFIPFRNRINPLDDDKFRNLISVQYRMSDMFKIRYKNYFTQSFMHATFETSIIKLPEVRENYLEMIAWGVDKFHIRKEKPGKILIFAVTGDMIVLIIDKLKKTYPDLDIRKYMSKDPFENVLEADICVSTLGSAGTALDIPDLTTVFLTVSLLSKVGNIQAFGRLRKIPDIELDFIYYWSPDIQSMQAHHNVKMKLLEPYVKTFGYDKYTKDLTCNRKDKNGRKSGNSNQRAMMMRLKASNGFNKKKGG